ncbi:RNA 2'-phosphotransferase [Bordetella sp. N]|uniref:RNA 2'-phosphotransferase n=1 Tax=Bordetella sp. N TaxID=1746199 RepID=UPI00070D368D|nr:RNA 2'-phosphotransferase [Bordetella sp. N]ALM82776.1 RNA 2'-phosphotransferase [Bordetella sp. N]
MSGSQQHEQVSKYLSYILRHEPHSIGVELDSEGWLDIKTLIDASAAHGRVLDDALVRAVVETSPKQRFQISEDSERIRAVQGHSASEVKRTFQELTPPALLYHGTATRFVASILESGLRKGERQYVHLSADLQTAISVGKRHGTPAVFAVQAQAMSAQGHKFFLAENGVWLADQVPARFLSLDLQ